MKASGTDDKLDRDGGLILLSLDSLCRRSEKVDGATELVRGKRRLILSVEATCCLFMVVKEVASIISAYSGHCPVASACAFIHSLLPFLARPEPLAAASPISCPPGLTRDHLRSALLSFLLSSATA